MSSQGIAHRITERCLAYSPSAQKPYRCKHCARLFRTKNASLMHQCEGERVEVAGSH